MSCHNYYLKGIKSLSQSLWMNGLEINLKTWLDWAFLTVGGFTNVSRPTESIYGADWHILTLDTSPEFVEGRVWRGCRKDWVWEGNITHTDPDTNDEYSPLEVELYVDNVLVDSSDYYVDYPLGRIVLDEAIDVESEVSAQYSFRQIQTYIADQADWWNELQYRSFRVDDAFCTQTDKGIWTIGAQHRIQMPCILLETVPRTRSRPYQIGDGARVVEQDVLCHVIAENRHSRNTIMDILTGQFDKNLQLFDVDQVALNEAFPLDYRGMIVDSGNTFPILSDAYPMERCRFSRTDCNESISINPRLFSGLVRLTCEVILND